MYKKIIGLFCVALMVTVVGCGVSRPPLTVVTGTVTYDGEVLANASISIMPSAGDGTARNASGITNAEGKFTLVTTFPDGELVDGAYSGTYTLRVVKYEKVDVVGEESGPPEDGFDPAEEMMSMMSARGGDDITMPGPKSLIHEKFSAVYSTDSNWDNNCEVGAIESPTTLTITLKSDGTGTIE
jgi:hypothetical protein